MGPTNDIGGWAKIQIHADSGDVGRLKFGISFQNSSRESQELQFSNRAFKAELLALRFYDGNGVQIPPQRREMIRLKNTAVESRMLAPGEEWLFELCGVIDDGCIQFRGAAYAIPDVRPIRVRFVYKRCESNLIELDV